jgi:hypothetical protein
VAAAFDVTVVSCFTETRERSSLLLASVRPTGNADTLAKRRQTSAFLNREAGIQELLRLTDDAPWERRFLFRPLLDVFGANGTGTTAVLQQLARKCSDHTCTTMRACKPPAFQSLSVALEERFRLPSSQLPQLPGSARQCRDELRKTV